MYGIMFSRELQKRAAYNGFISNINGPTNEDMIITAAFSDNPAAFAKYELPAGATDEDFEKMRKKMVRDAIAVLQKKHNGA